MDASWEPCKNSINDGRPPMQTPGLHTDICGWGDCAFDLPMSEVLPEHNLHAYILMHAGSNTTNRTLQRQRVQFTHTEPAYIGI